MITGYFNEKSYPCIQVAVIGTRGQRIIEALIDTGCDGDLCLPIQVAIQLGLDLIATQQFELADGSIQNRLVFSGEMELVDIERFVEIILTESKEALIGSGLFRDKTLEIDYLNREVLIKASKH